MRAKFQSKEEQRKFFLDVKKATKMGSRKLSMLLDLKSRGGLESYTAARTSPELEIVRKLEEISGVKGNYEIVEVGRLVVKGKRKFMSMPVETAREVLKKRFGKNYFEVVIGMIDQGYKQEDILKKLREYNYKFDSSLISKAIGSLRTHDRVKYVDKLKLSDDLILKGIVQDGGRGLTVSFNIGKLYDKFVEKKISIEIEGLNKVRIYPFKNGKKLFHMTGKRIGFHLPPTVNLKHNSKVEIYINFKEFGFDKLDSIQDSDARILLKAALTRGFNLYPYRSTTGNLMGDIVLEYKNKIILIEITRARSDQIANWKLGQALLQKINYPSFEHFMVVRKGLLRKAHIKAMDYIGTKCVFTDFENDWENDVLEDVKNQIDS